jgi:hypothetical protein
VSKRAKARPRGNSKALGAKYHIETARREKACRKPVEVEPIMVEALRGQNMGFKNPRWARHKIKARGADLQEQEEQGAQPQRRGKAWVVKPQG